MGRAKLMCEYCHKAFEDSQEARRRHFQGRNHKANVKLWYDSFADQAQRSASEPAAATAWTPAAAAAAATPPAPAFDPRSLPPSMLPAPPDAFLFTRADWG